MKIKSPKIAIVASACIAAGAAHADALSWDPSWGFSGFGTLAYTKTDTDDGQFVNPGQYGGVKKDGGIGTDSLLGLQLNGQANNVFSATVQALVERNGKGNYQPQVEWAFLKAQVTPSVVLRAGRMGLPFFLVSDYRHVNYSNLWVRPPVDVYGQSPVSTFNGADATYRTNVGSTSLTSQIYYGKVLAWIGGTHATGSHMMGLNVSADFDYGITLRAGTAKTKIAFQNSPIGGLADVIAETGSPSVAAELTGQDLSFSGIGASIDHENFVGNAEYTVRRTNFFVPTTKGWEITGGYHLGKFTPYVVASQVKVADANLVNTIPAIPQLAQLYGAIEGFISTGADNQHSKALGLRWDAYHNVALKAQYDRIQVESGSSGIFQKADAALSQKAVNVFALSCDFVF